MITTSSKCLPRKSAGRFRFTDLPYQTYPSAFATEPVGQRIPEAAATLTSELQAQAQAASACCNIFYSRLDRLAAEITEGFHRTTRFCFMSIHSLS